VDLSLGGSWTIPLMNITGDEGFDTFFSLCVLCGLMAMMLGWLFNIVNRS
jgi:hypothetical protein